MEHMEINTDKEQKKAVIIIDEQGLSDLRAACIAYCCQWIDERKKAEAEGNKLEVEKYSNLNKKYSDYWEILFDAGEQLRDKE